MSNPRSLMRIIEDKLNGLETLRCLINYEIAQVQDKNFSLVYLIVDIENKKVKIGLTGNLPQRYKALSAFNSTPLIIFHYEVYTSRQEAQARETELRQKYREYLDIIPPVYPDQRVLRREWYIIEGELKTWMQQIYREKQRWRNM